MIIYKNSNVISQLSVSLAFLKFCKSRERKTMVFHSFYMVWVRLLYFLHIYKEEKYLEKKWSFLPKLTNLNEILRDFKATYLNSLYASFSPSSSSHTVLMDDAPHFILKTLFGDRIKTILGLPINRKGEFTDTLTSLKTVETNYVTAENTMVYLDPNDAMVKKLEQMKYVIDGQYYETKKQCQKAMFKNFLKDMKYILLFAVLLLFMTLCYGFLHIRLDVIFSIMLSPTLMILNYIPIVFVLLLFYCLFSRLSTTFLFGGLLIFILSMINYFKLSFREEPFFIGDIFLIQEASDMAGKYSIVLDYRQWLTILLILFIAWKFRTTYKQYKQRGLLRIGVAIMNIAIFVSLFFSVYQNYGLYNSLGNVDNINRWSTTQQYQIRGFLYPLLYSYSYAFEQEPENYDPQGAADILASYTYEDIPEEKKANVIGIMLESYNDFSRFDSFEFEMNPYENFQALQKESISGYYTANIFAGGTVSSERSFLNGYQNHPGYAQKTNSFVHYFNEQGYYTDAMHPSYGWFYNRRNVNSYLGFDNFYYIDNYFDDFVDDTILFEDVIEGYENNKDRDQPYFNFTVTYQNHGPYADFSLVDDVYLKRNETIEDAPYYTTNNYFAGIHRTDQALKELIDYFKAEDEATIIVLFGDHNPLLGDENIGYKQNGLSVDLATLQGFQEYYDVPYIIWGNESAKEMYGVSFEDDQADERFSPLYFIPKLFTYLGLEGNEYMQYLNDIYQRMKVMNPTFYLMDDEWQQLLNKEQQLFYDAFKNVEYYYSHRFGT